jgi:hypothetical protein
MKRNHFSMLILFILCNSFNFWIEIPVAVGGGCACYSPFFCFILAAHSSEMRVFSLAVLDSG